MMTFKKNGNGEINNLNLLRLLQERFNEMQKEKSVVQTHTIKTLETDRQSIDARLNDYRQTADEANHKTTNKMMHDLRIL